MNTNIRTLQNVATSFVIVVVATCCYTTDTFASPTITVTWNENPGPTSPEDYEVDYTVSAYPDVELKAESNTWKIKSVDGVNPGDIGYITAGLGNDYGLPGGPRLKGLSI